MGQLAYLGVGSQDLELVAEDVTAMACITNNSVQAYISGVGYRFFWGSTKVTNQDGTDFVPPSTIIGRTSGIVNDYWFLTTAPSNATVYAFYKDKVIGNYYLSGSINYFARGVFATVYGANQNNWILFSNGQRLTGYTGSLNNPAINLLGCGGVFFTVSGTTYYVYDENGTQIDTFTSPSTYVSSVPESLSAGSSAYGANPTPSPPLALGAYSSDTNWLVPFHALLNCQQCLGFWVGLFAGLILFGLLWSVLFALLVSLLAVWNDFGLLAISRIGATPQISQHTWMPPASDPKTNTDPSQS
jgi:hypothetical protein